MLVDWQNRREFVHGGSMNQLLACVRCAVAVEPGAAFCGHCGAALAPAGDPSAAVPRWGAASDLTRYLCAAAYLDRAYATALVAQIADEPHLSVAPAPACDVPVVLRHAAFAAVRRHHRDLLLAVLLVLGLALLLRARVTLRRLNHADLGATEVISAEGALLRWNRSTDVPHALVRPGTRVGRRGTGIEKGGYRHSTGTRPDLRVPYLRRARDSNPRAESPPPTVFKNEGGHITTTPVTCRVECDPPASISGGPGLAPERSRDLRAPGPQMDVTQRTTAGRSAGSIGVQLC